MTAGRQAALITYVEFDGTSHPAEVDHGLSVMEGAINKGIPGIDGDCGGACACATCHVYVDSDWIDRLEEPSVTEASMLEWAPGMKPTSRLSCQIRVTQALDGLVVRMPESQR